MFAPGPMRLGIITTIAGVALCIMWTRLILGVTTDTAVSSTASLMTICISNLLF